MFANELNFSDILLYSKKGDDRGDKDLGIYDDFDQKEEEKLDEDEDTETLPLEEDDETEEEEENL